jgi:hypothetical protein
MRLVNFALWFTDVILIIQKKKRGRELIVKSEFSKSVVL